MGIFSRLEGRLSWEEEEELEKTEERVAKGERWRIRRARMALSRDVGMRFVDSEEDGWAVICFWEEMSVGRDKLLVSWRKELRSRAPKGALGIYIARKMMKDKQSSILAEMGDGWSSIFIDIYKW